VEDWVAIETLSTAGELAAIAARTATLWMPAWSRLALADWLALERWLASGRAAAARARLEIVGARSTVGAGRAIVLARSGAVSLRAGTPAARPGAHVDALLRPWTVAPPGDLSEHLRGVNRQTTAAVRLSAEDGRAPAPRDLLAPFATLPARLLGGSGPWRQRLSHLVLESYRAVLLAAKTWEARSLRTADSP
jgi:hypothetical protein